MGQRSIQSDDAPLDAPPKANETEILADCVDHLTDRTVIEARRGGAVAAWDEARAPRAKPRLADGVEKLERQLAIPVIALAIPKLPRDLGEHQRVGAAGEIARERPDSRLRRRRVRTDRGLRCGRMGGEGDQRAKERSKARLIERDERLQLAASACTFL